MHVHTHPDTHTHSQTHMYAHTHRHHALCTHMHMHTGITDSRHVLQQAIESMTVVCFFCRLMLDDEKRVQLKQDYILMNIWLMHKILSLLTDPGQT